MRWMNGGKLTEWVLAGIYHLIITVSAILHIGCQIMPDHLYFVWYVMGIHVKGTLAKKKMKNTHTYAHKRRWETREKNITNIIDMIAFRLASFSVLSYLLWWIKRR